jgi:hypothetical protein
VDDKKDLTDTPDFWAHLVVAGFQPRHAEDKDPQSEAERRAETVAGYEVSVIYLETIRDEFASFDPVKPFPQCWSFSEQQYRKAVSGTVAHETGHAPGARSEADNHREGQLMDGPYKNETGQEIQGQPPSIEKDFAGATIRRFRQALRWHQ